MHHKPTAILYHGGCPDGFGAAYAAWKKFGDEADYIPVRYHEPFPTHLEGKDLYMVDFCYAQETMDALLKQSKSLTVLDHHEGTEQVVKSMPQHVYDATRSGATIAWGYFHPNTPVPTLIQYVEDADLFKMLPDAERAIITYVYAQPFQFEVWDRFVAEIEAPEKREKIVERGSIYQEYFQLLVQQFVDTAELVSFEGYTCYLSAGGKMFTTPVGMKLSEKQPPISIILRASAKGFGVSLRSDGTVDVSKIAQKYGGNGHPSSAAFSLPWGTPLPWQLVSKKES